MSNLNRSWKRAAIGLRLKYGPRRYRVWTKNANETISLMTDWGTYGEAKRFIIGRWRHHPPFAFISEAKSTEIFRRYHK